MRVSTLAMNNAAIANVMKNQAALSEVQMQVSTELKSQSYSGIASDTEILKSLENDLASSLNNVENAEMVLTRVETSYSAVNSMVDLLADFQVELSSAMSGNSASSASINTQAQVALDSFAQLANTQLAGRYLFAGSRTDTAPVDVSSATYTAQTYPSTQSLDYYQGNSDETAFYASDDLKIDYGATADEEGFEKAIRALSLAATASEDPVDTDALNEAYDLLNEAMDALLVTQSRLSNAASAIEDQIDVELDLQLRLDAAIGDIKEVDLAAVITEQEQLETLLEASYSVTASLSKMNLLDYL